MGARSFYVYILASRIGGTLYFECFDQIEQAIHREKRLKKRPRAWKISLIEKESQLE